MDGEENKDDIDKNGPPSSTTKTPGSGGGGPIIQQSQESEEYQRALQTVVGTALGVILLVGLLALFFLIYRLRRQRRRARNLNGSSPHSPILNRSISVDGGSKPVPSVLVLYAYDCAVHEAVVAALSGLLMEVCGVTVSLDAFEESVIMERGLEEWLEDRLQEADFIIVVCSLGARLRCSKKRVRFKEELGRALPDYFAVAVDYVAEKLRVERSKGLGTEKFVCVVMDYSRLSDIPPQLEAASVFNLMRDFTALCNHLTASCPNARAKMREAGENGEETDSWQGTEVGAELWAALGQAHDYFKSHPNWLEDRIEPVPPHPRTRPRRRRRGRERREQSMLPLLPMEKLSNSNFDPFNPTAPSAQMSRGYSGAKWVTTSSGIVVHINNGPTKTGGYFTHSRQNSLPSSLCSSHLQSGTTSAQLQQGVSRSVDSFPAVQPTVPDYCDDTVCLYCQQQQGGWGGRGRVGRKMQCPIHPYPQPHPAGEHTIHSDTDGDSELELGMEAGTGQRCSRSKSLPSVGLVPRVSQPHLHQLTTSHTVLEGFSNTSLSRSSTVLQAEVHKEWGANRDSEEISPFSPAVPSAVTSGGHSRTKQTKELTEDKVEISQECVPIETETITEQEIWIPPKDGGMSRVWDSELRPSGRASPSSLSSNSTSSHSDDHSGSDSLERDLKSFTLPATFEKAGESTYYPFVPKYATAPPGSLSSSAVAAVAGPRIRPIPCLTPVQPVKEYDFGISLAPLSLKDTEELNP